MVQFNNLDTKIELIWVYHCSTCLYLHIWFHLPMHYDSGAQGFLCLFMKNELIELLAKDTDVYPPLY